MCLRMCTLPALSRLVTITSHPYPSVRRCDGHDDTVWGSCGVYKVGLEARACSASQPSCGVFLTTGMGLRVPNGTDHVRMVNPICAVLQGTVSSFPMSSRLLSKALGPTSHQQFVAEMFPTLWLCSSYWWTYRISQPASWAPAIGLAAMKFAMSSTWHMMYVPDCRAPIPISIWHTNLRKY